jgi:hypothetical protein
MRSHVRSNQRGMALLFALLALLVASAVGLGLMYMSSGEGMINANYRDSQAAFFGMRAGLEEGRDRVRANSSNLAGTTSWAITPPTNFPGSAGSIVYILNSSGAAVAPTTAGTAYFDDEFCHETFTGLALANPGTGVPCTAAAPSTNVTTYTSQDPNTGTSSAMAYKWVRITLKQNNTIPNAVVDSSQGGGVQVCWDGGQEIAITRLGYASCTAAQNAGYTVNPVYIVTSLAVTANGSRRIGQYEIGMTDLTPPDSALALDGPAATFNPAPSSNNYFASGTDAAQQSGYHWTGPANGCTPVGSSVVPAISVTDTTGQSNVTNDIPTNRYGNYSGTNVVNPVTGTTTPNVVNVGATGATPTLTGNWSSPSYLNQLVSNLANTADVTYSCGIGAPCNGSAPYGTDANPQITYVNGDFNFGSNSGAGLLIVTGTLNITGNSSFDGLILVIGQGKLVENGGGHGQFNGSIFIADTNSTSSPYSQLATLGTPSIAWNGGGTNGIQYNSCWANIANQIGYQVIASREEMY